MSFYDTSIFEMHPKADEKFVIQGDKYRITVLTERLFRLEYSKDGVFEDRATRLAFNRAFATPSFESYREGGYLHVVTKYLHLTYDEKEFSDAFQRQLLGIMLVDIRHDFQDKGIVSFGQRERSGVCEGSQAVVLQHIQNSFCKRQHVTFFEGRGVFNEGGLP